MTSMRTESAVACQRKTIAELGATLVELAANEMMIGTLGVEVAGGVAVAVDVGVLVVVAVSDGVKVSDGVNDADGTVVGVSDGVSVGVGDGVSVSVGIVVSVGVKVAVTVGKAALVGTSTTSAPPRCSWMRGSSTKYTAALRPTKIINRIKSKIQFRADMKPPPECRRMSACYDQIKISTIFVADEASRVPTDGVRFVGTSTMMSSSTAVIY
jgi:hypothetical protein